MNINWNTASWRAAAASGRSEPMRSCWRDEVIAGCVHAHLRWARAAVSVFFFFFPCFGPLMHRCECVSVCLLALVRICVCERGLLTSSAVTLRLLTTPIRRMSGRRGGEGLGIGGGRSYEERVCLWEEARGRERALHANCCNPRTKVHRRGGETAPFFF